MPVVTPFPKKPNRRYHAYKSYDEELGKTPGLIYAPHCPKTAEIIDRLELARCLKKQRHEDVAGLIVAAYQHLKPSISLSRQGGRKFEYKVKYPQWDRLPQEAKALMYAVTSEEMRFHFTHMATVHLDNFEIMIAQGRREGPARIVGGLINKYLEPIYRRAGHKLSYLYVVEVAPLRLEDENANLLHERSELDSFHVSLALRIPEDIVDPVAKALCRAFKTPRRDLFRYHSGQAAHVATISDERAFTKGGDQSGRNGLVGRVDYACKGLRRLHTTKSFYDQFSLDPLPLGRWASASNDVRGAARKQYDELRKMLMTPLTDAVQAALNGNRFEREAEFKKFAASSCAVDETLQRIAACDPILSRIHDNIWFLDQASSLARRLG